MLQLRVFLLPVTAVILGLAQARESPLCPQNDQVSCLPIASGQIGQNLMGGWAAQDVQNLNEIQGSVNNFVNFALNGCIDDIRNSPVSLLELYTQVVAGVNYCIHIRIENTHCILEVYEPFGSEEPDVKVSCAE